MSVALTYLGFHAAFILPPIGLLAWLAARRDAAEWGWRPLSGIAIIVGIAVAYTTPWTNLMIPEGVWWYGEGAVLATIWYTPVEEYLFFVLQPILTGLWLCHVLRVADRPLSIPTTHRLIGVVLGVAISGVGWWLMGTTATYYLGSLLWWAGPILAIQWGFGLTYLLELRRTVAVAVAVPTLYLWVVDRIAIELGIWVISDAHTTGYAIVGLPVEEALFFLLTNVFIVQGVTMYVWVLDRRPGLASTDWVGDRAERLRARLPSP